MRLAPIGYIIDVCRHCGRLAVWPGCEHRQSHADWTTSVRVRTSETDRRRLQGLMDEGPAEDVAGERSGTAAS